MQDIKINIVNGKPVMQLEFADSLFNNIYLSLFVRRGTWFHDLAFGSEIHTIKKITDTSIARLKQMCETALQWVITIGRAKSIDVNVVRINNVHNALGIIVTVIKNSGESVTFNLFHSLA